MQFHREMDKASIQAKKYSLHHKELNVLQLKNGLYQFLLRNGFEMYIVNRIIEREIESYSIDEKELLKKAKEKYITSHRLNLNNQIDYQKALGYLIRKGYKYEDVIEVLRRS